MALLASRMSSCSRSEIFTIPIYMFCNDSYIHRIVPGGGCHGVFAGDGRAECAISDSNSARRSVVSPGDERGEEGQLSCRRIMAAGNAPAAIGGVIAGKVPSFRRSAERKVSPGTAERWRWRFPIPRRFAAGWRCTAASPRYLR